MDPYPKDERTPERQDILDQQRNRTQVETDRRVGVELQLQRCRQDYNTLREELLDERVMHSGTAARLARQISDLQVQLNNAELLASGWARQATLLRDAMVRAVERIAAGKAGFANDDLRQALTRDGEANPMLWPVSFDAGNVPVAGRNLRSPVASFNTSQTGVVVRVDDGANPEFWCEISISRIKLIQLVARIASNRQDDAGEK